MEFKLNKKTFIMAKWHSRNIAFQQLNTISLSTGVGLVQGCFLLERCWREYTTSAPNHSCPAKLSWRISSGNLTQKSLLARSSGIHSSIIWLIMFSTLSCRWETGSQIEQTSWRGMIEVNFESLIFVPGFTYPKKATVLQCLKTID